MPDYTSTTDDYIDDAIEAGYNGEILFNKILDRGFYSNDEMIERGTRGQLESAIFDELLNDENIYSVEEANRIFENIELNNLLSELIGDDDYTFSREVAQDAIAEGERRRAEYRDNLELEDMFEVVETQQNKRTSYKIGFNFNGIKEIKEFENEQFFIPNSNHCIFKCLEKFYELEGKTIDLDYNFTKSNITLEGFRKHLSTLKIDENETPQIFKIVIENKKQIVKTLKHENKHTDNKYAILLLPQQVNKTIFHHSILLKIPEEARRNRGEAKIIKLDYLNELLPNIVENLSYQQNKTLSDKSERIPQIIPKNKNVSLYTFDYETYNKQGLQIPTGVSLVKFDMSGKIDFTTHFLLECYEEPQATTTAQEKMQNEFIDFIFKDMENTNNYDAEIYSHNGGAFDIILLKHHLKNPIYKWSNTLKAGGRIKTIDLIKSVKTKVLEDGVEKELTFKYTLKFKDSMSFVLCSLKDACETLKTKEKHGVEKLDFAIADLDLNYYKNATIEEGKEWPEWVEYMRIDSLSLAYVIIEAEKMFNIYMCSFIGYAGLPSIAWKIISTNARASFLNVYIHKDLTTEKFVRASQYGGRIVHWRVNFKENETIFNCPILGEYKSKGLISLDANSLYPSAEAKFEYPHGKPQVINNEMSFIAFEEITKDKLYIAEISYKTGNQKHIITPYKQDKPRLLQYKCSPGDDCLYGVYNSVDIEEMKHEGYEIQTVYRAVIYKKKSLMFDNIINQLYNERKESPDEVIKYIIKIILNATYGKFSEDIDSTTAYKEKDNGNKEIGHMLLGNGQTEYNYRLLANCGKKPAQIGSFILAYARKIMNKLIRDLGRENILYGDTDSIYCTIESWEYLQKNNEYYNGLNTDLGGFKNDYGDGVLITEAYFLDNKRYFLKFNNPIKGKAYKVKFNGLNWKKAHAGALKDSGAKYGEDLKEADKISWIFKGFMNKYFKGEKIDIINSFKQVKFRRGETINICNITQNYSLAPDTRGQWTTNENGDYVSYPLNYDFNKPELIRITRNDYLRSKTPERPAPYIIKQENGEILMNKPLEQKCTLKLKFKEEKEPQTPKFLYHAGEDLIFILRTKWVEDKNIERIANGTEQGWYESDYYYLDLNYGIGNKTLDGDYSHLDKTQLIPLLAIKTPEQKEWATKSEVIDYNKYETMSTNRTEDMTKQTNKKRKFIKDKRVKVEE